MARLRKHRNLISVSQIPKTIQRILGRLHDHGYDAKLVGGCVRDLLLGVTPKDFDVVTNATPVQIKHIFSRAHIIGRRFPIVHVRSDLGIVEISTYRKPSKTTRKHRKEQGLKLHDVQTYGSIKQDYFLRDFTINALYYDLRNQLIYDYVRGLDDINHRVLRTLGDDQERFKEDSHRVLRAIRFKAKLNLELTPSLEDALSNSRHLLQGLEPHRLRYDLEKLFLGGYGVAVFNELLQYDFFDFIFPGVDQNDPLVLLSLNNTDQRVHMGKSARLAFLFTAFYWRQFQDHATHESLEADWNTSQLIFDQLESTFALTNVIKVFAFRTWILQHMMDTYPPHHPKQIMAYKRFRAGYDLLWLRSKTGEVDQKISDWWTRIQEVSLEEREQMINALAAPKKRRRRRRKRKPAQTNPKTAANQ